MNDGRYSFTPVMRGRHLTRENPSPIWPITCLVGR